MLIVSTLKLAAIILPMLTMRMVVAEPTPATNPSSVVDVDEKTHIHLLGVSGFPAEAQGWCSFAGEPIELPDERLLQARVMAQPEPEHMIGVRVEKPESTVVELKVAGAAVVANSQTQDDDSCVLISAFSLEGGAKEVTIEIGIADEDWKSVATQDKPAEGASFDVPDIGEVSFEPISEGDGGASVVIHSPAIESPHRVVVVDDTGATQISNNVNVQTTNDSSTATYILPIPAEKTRKILLQTRGYSKSIEVSHISLEPGTITRPQVTVRDLKKGK